MEEFRKALNDLIAQALAEGVNNRDIAEMLSAASNQAVLDDPEGGEVCAAPAYEDDEQTAAE